MKYFHISKQRKKQEYYTLLGCSLVAQRVIKVNVGYGTYINFDYPCKLIRFLGYAANGGVGTKMFKSHLLTLLPRELVKF